MKSCIGLVFKSKYKESVHAIKVINLYGPCFWQYNYYESCHTVILIATNDFELYRLILYPVIPMNTNSVCDSVVFASLLSRSC